MARARLAEAAISYLDLTGNLRIVMDRPGLFIEARGADRDPSPPERGVRSLKGAKAARIVRALCDWKPPVGVRELAERAETDPGYTTRVLALLERENVIGRDRKGAVESVNWQDLIRTWTRDYGVTSSNRSQLFIEVRSTTALVERIQRATFKYAVTGSRAVPAGASIAPPRLISCYVQSIELAAQILELKPADDTGNVILLEPFDQVVWQRTRKDGSLTVVAVSQCAADLLTGSAREPAEGEALLRWMERNESDWRA